MISFTLTVSSTIISTNAVNITIAVTVIAPVFICSHIENDRTSG